MSYELRGPLALPFPSGTHRDDPDGFYTALSHALLAAAATSLPALRAHVPFDADEPPTMVVFIGFADWGQEPASGGRLEKYFVWKAVQQMNAGALQAGHEIPMAAGAAAEPTPEAARTVAPAAVSAESAAPAGSSTPKAISLDDISLTGGSRSSFIGRRTRADVQALRCFQQVLLRAQLDAALGPAPASAAAGPAPLPSPSPASEHTSTASSDCTPPGQDATATHAPIPVVAPASTGTASQWWREEVGVGLGLVTQEAWMHPEVSTREAANSHTVADATRFGCNVQVYGSDAVTYHEGLGHALAMPHPSRRQKRCVMDLGMYQVVPIAQLEICAEIKADMRYPGGGDDENAAYVRAPLSWFAPGARPSGQSLAEAVARTLLVAHAAKSAITLAPSVPVVIGWVPIFSNPDSREVSVFMRWRPLLCAEDGSSSVTPVTIQRDVESATSDDSGVDAWHAALPRNAAGRIDARILLEHSDGAPFIFGGEWTELQFAAGVGAPAHKPRTYLPMFLNAEYHFREIMWQTPAETTGHSIGTWVHSMDGASVARSRGQCWKVVMLDSNRDIAICIVGHRLFLSASGLFGDYFEYHGGHWTSSVLRSP